MNRFPIISTTQSRKSAALTAAAGFAALLLVAGCATNAQPPSEIDTTPVRLVQVETSRNALPIEAVGALEPSSTARLSFKVGGPIARITADAGDRVRRGQLLAVLATDEIDAAVAQAGAALEKARRDAERMDRLLRDSVVTLAQFQDAQTALSLAESAFSSATFNRSYAQIVAPANGRVLRRHAEPGELVQPGSTVLEVGYEGDWVVNISITDRDVVRLQTGNAVAIEFDALPGKTFDGNVTRVGEAANPRTGAFDVEISIEKPDARLRSGFIARAAITPADAEELTLVPAEALVRAEGRIGRVFVYNAASETVSERSVTIAGMTNDRLAISSGLTSGDRVVTDGAPYLTDGTSVTVVDNSTRQTN